MADIELAGGRGTLVVKRWDPSERATFVVLLVHGYGEHGGRYAHVAAALAKAGAVVYAPDHYGHGRSAGPRAIVDDLDAMARDVGKVAELAAREHAGLPVVMLGHSMGGMIATRFVQLAIAPVKALVLSGPVVGGSPGIFALAEMDPVPDIPLDPAGLSRDPEVGKAYAADPLVYHGPFAKPTLLEFIAAVKKIGAGPSFGALPTLWIHGEHDPLAPYDVTKQAMAHLQPTEQKVYAGAMHEIFNETNQAEVIGDAVAFFRRYV